MRARWTTDVNRVAHIVAAAAARRLPFVTARIAATGGIRGAAADFALLCAARSARLVAPVAAGLIVVVAADGCEASEAK